jgi:hypothetical protein
VEYGAGRLGDGSVADEADVGALGGTEVSCGLDTVFLLSLPGFGSGASETY